MLHNKLSVAAQQGAQEERREEENLLDPPHDSVTACHVPCRSVWPACLSRTPFAVHLEDARVDANATVRPPRVLTRLSRLLRELLVYNCVATGVATPLS